MRFARWGVEWIRQMHPVARASGGLFAVVAVLAVLSHFKVRSEYAIARHEAMLESTGRQYDSIQAWRETDLEGAELYRVADSIATAADRRKARAQYPRR